MRVAYKNHPCKMRATHSPRNRAYGENDEDLEPKLLRGFTLPPEHNVATAGVGFTGFSSEHVVLNRPKTAFASHGVRVGLV